MNGLVVAFVVLLLLKVTVSTVLDVINLRYLRVHAKDVPDAFRGFIDSDTYRKSVEYSMAKTRFSIAHEIYDALVLALVILCGFLPWLFVASSNAIGYSIGAQSVVFCFIVLLLSMPNMPFDWWGTFRLEERFGFNKSTFKLWCSDKVKGVVIAAFVSLPLVALLLFFVRSVGNAWWVYGFVAFFAFQLIMVVAYPMFIMPLFNKLEPIEEGELKQRLFALADRSGFKAKTILVMDGSKRSGHSNAFFAGFGGFRRIVLFDTLIEQMSTSQIEAVLAHEIGHYKLGHIPKMLLLSGFLTLSLFALLGALSASTQFAEAFYFSSLSQEQLIIPVFLLFLTMGGLIGFWMSPISNAISRKHEYEADAFACEAMGESESLISALRQLHRENLSNLTPHPVYSAFHYSHPTLAEREAAMR
jgi:STE24 endopeptidase